MNLLHPITHDSQYYAVPEDCVNGDNVGKVNFHWSHQKFYNRLFGTALTDASYTFQIVNGNADGAFQINGGTGELTVLDASQFTATRNITVRIFVAVGYFQDTICEINRIPAADIIYFDYTVSGTAGSGTRADPYKRWQEHAFGGANLGSGTPGKYYLYKRNQTFTDWIKVRNPLIGGNPPPYITVGAWGQGARPIIDGTANELSNRFMDIGSATLNGSTVTEATNPERVAYNIRVMDIETKYENVGDWYPYQIGMYGSGHRFHRIKCSDVYFQDGFMWFRNTIAANAGRIYTEMYDVEMYDSKYRAIKFESGDITGRNFRCHTTYAATETPISAANRMNVDLKYGDCQCTDNTIGLGLQIRARDHHYEWFYLKGYKEALVPFSHTSHDGQGEDFRPRGSFKNILLDGTTANEGAFYTNGGSQKADGILYKNIDSINAAVGCNGLTVSDGATNTEIQYAKPGGDRGVIVYESATGTKLINLTVTGQIDLRAAAQIINTLYGSITGAGVPAFVTSTEAPAPANFVDYPADARLVAGSALIQAGTDQSILLDIENKTVLIPPSQGAYEFPLPDYTLSLIVQPSNGGSVSGSGDYAEGETVPLMATPNTGWTFAYWMEDGLVISTSTSYTYTMPGADTTLTAFFELTGSLADIPATLPMELSANKIFRTTQANAANYAAGNYELYGELRVETEPGSSIFSRTLTMRLSPNAADQATFELQDGIADFFPLADFNPFGSFQLALTDDNQVRAQFYTAESYGDPAILQALSLVDTFRVLNGGIPKILDIDFFGDYLPQSRQFLTWHPGKKRVSTDQPELLHFYAYTGISKLFYRIKVYFSDQTSISQLISETSNIQEGRIYRMPSGYTALSVNGVNPEKKVIKYEVWLEDQDGFTVALPFSYLVDPISPPNGRYWMFTNSLGMWEIMRTEGKTTENMSVDRELSSGYLQQGYVRTRGELRIRIMGSSSELEVSSGYLSSKEEAEWTKEILLSEKVFLITPEQRTPYLILTDSFQVSRDQEYTWYLRFEARQAYNDTKSGRI